VLPSYAAQHNPERLPSRSACSCREAQDAGNAGLVRSILLAPARSSPCRRTSSPRSRRVLDCGPPDPPLRPGQAGPRFQPSAFSLQRTQYTLIPCSEMRRPVGGSGPMGSVCVPSMRHAIVTRSPSATVSAISKRRSGNGVREVRRRSLHCSRESVAPSYGSPWSL
jgi:hypothetical protein